jgi:hypothetical protein
MVLNRKIAGAMADQLDRVNSRPADLLDQIVKLQEEVKRLREELRRERERSTDQPRETMTYCGRPVLSLPKVAKKLGISYWKANRLAVADHWQHEINESGHYLIYADQELTVPPRKQKSRRK